MLSLIAGRQRQSGVRRSGQSNFAFQIDAVIREEHHFSSEATSYPIQDGSFISDHIMKKPIEFTLDGFTSNTPISILGGLLSAGGLSGNEYRSQNAFDTLRIIWQNKELVTVVSGFRVYSDMVIIDLNFPRNPNTGQAVDFSIRFQQIIKVQFGTVPMPAEEQLDMATPEQNIGSQPLQEEPVSSPIGGPPVRPLGPLDYSNPWFPGSPFPP